LAGTSICPMLSDSMRVRVTGSTVVAIDYSCLNVRIC
jgi:hypothetical protein